MKEKEQSFETNGKGWGSIAAFFLGLISLALLVHYALIFLDWVARGLIDYFNSLHLW